MASPTNCTDLETQETRIWIVLLTFLVALLILSRVYEIVAVSLSAWRFIPTVTVRGLFEKQPLLIAHIPILFFAGLAAYTLPHWKAIFGSTVLAALSWTAISASGHVLAAVFC